MKRIIVSINILVLLATMGINLPMASAGEYQTTKGSGSFSVTAPAKVIYGKSEDIIINLNSELETLYLKVPVSSFQFRNNFTSDSMNAAIYDRFNNYYMQSSQYPYVIYNAKITNAAAIDFNTDGSYPIHATGALLVHGVQQQVMTKGLLKVKNGKISVEANIVILPTDYNIHIPDYIGNMYFKEVRIESKAELNKVH